MANGVPITNDNCCATLYYSIEIVKTLILFAWCSRFFYSKECAKIIVTLKRCVCICASDASWIPSSLIYQKLHIQNTKSVLGIPRICFLGIPHGDSYIFLHMCCSKFLPQFPCLTSAVEISAAPRFPHCSCRNSCQTTFPSPQLPKFLLCHPFLTPAAEIPAVFSPSSPQLPGSCWAGHPSPGKV